MRIILGVVMTLVGVVIFRKRADLERLNMELNRMVWGRPIAGPSGVFAHAAMLVLGVMGIAVGLSLLWGGVFCWPTCG
ncbi:MAG: hypothetical protein EXR52_02220 [Dehalococcoidia bacterium]|nr:hypothetical protein [Dehalococcoidia bacterium]